ncbi:hypothetical protein EJ03DRAFT_347646 [Teratosphaeria nubilosa]|uniref:Uncharacterized protein n=1 Tax=Teratosphaeria nubilosa TaxID=161662 RepID=A0A6G1LLD2_9PEZI|nr:hypothetical protein EJ03DRAFT_347646 [Teratosphaeria nubilosa]
MYFEKATAEGNTACVTKTTAQPTSGSSSPSVAESNLVLAGTKRNGGSVEETVEWVRGAIAKAKEEKRRKADKSAELKYEQMEKQAIETLRAQDGLGKKEEEIEFVDEKEAKEHVATLKKREERQRRAVDKRMQKKANECSSWLSQRAGDRLAGRKPTDEKRPTLVYRDVSTILSRNVHEEHMANLSNAKPTAEQSSELLLAQKFGPNYLSRAASLTHGDRFETFKRGTNGFTAQNLVMPAADTTPTYGVYPSIGDFRQGELTWMLGHHLMWTDLPQDQFSSYTNSPIFVVTHALGRSHTGQGVTTIQFLDRRKAIGIDRKPAKFYPALKLYDIFEQARIEILIRDGLFDIFPAFEVARNRVRAGLYTSQVVFRKIGFFPNEKDAKKKKLIYSYENCSAVMPITNELLEKVKKVTLNFMLDDEMEMESKEPHIHAFITFLCFEKRPRKDPNFMTWIKSQYKASDVIDLFDDGAGGIQPGFTHVANNLPDVMQYLDLVRDACDAFGLAQLPDNVVHTQNALSDDKYEAMDNKCQRTAMASKAYDRDAQRDARDKANARRRQKNDDEKKRRAAGLPSKGAGSGTNKALETGGRGDRNGTVSVGALGLGLGTATVMSQNDPVLAQVEEDSGAEAGANAAGA